MNRLVRVMIINVLFFSQSMLSFVGPVTPGQSLWGIVKREAETVDIIESKVCEQDSQLDIIESKIDAIPSDASLLELIVSKVCEIDSQLDIIESQIDAIDTNNLLELIESKVCEIDSQLDIVESKIDAFDVSSNDSLLEMVESKVCEIDSQLDIVESKIDAIPNDASLLELIASKVCKIDSQLDVVESKIDDSAVIEQLIASKVCEIDSQLDVVESKIDDSVVIEQLIESKVCEIDSQLDVVESKIEVPSCSPPGISSPTTISQSGIYCLTNAIAGTITISASDVMLDLNNYTVSNGIVVDEGVNRIIIKNGAVSGTADAILVSAETTSITISDVVVKNAIRGINFDNVIGGLIQRCEMTQNTTGLAFNNCRNIVVQDCIASCNTHAGYDLLGGSDNYFASCKALSTGEGNTNVTDNNVFGFSAANGRANIFERCIAHSTQALTTTDFNSLIAGFVLRGSESCTKIIECEAANSMADESGETKPYGILLEAHLDQLQSVTGVLPSLEGGAVREAAWSPSGSFIALVGVSSLPGDNVQVYEFNRVTNDIFKVAEDLTVTDNNAIEWSPNGQYLATGPTTGDRFRVLKFDPFYGTLTTVGSAFSSGTVQTIKWSPDGRYIAVGGSLLSGDGLRIFEFRPETVDFILSVGGAFSSEGVSSVDWSPDGRYIAVGGDLAVNILQVVEFNRTMGTIVSIAGALGAAGGVRSVDWSSDGRYIAAGGLGLTGGTGDEFQVVAFESSGLTFMLTPVAGALGTAGTVMSVNWSPNGRYIVVGGDGLTGGTGDEVQVLEFDRGINSLTPRAGIFDGSFDFIQAVEWSPDGAYILAAGDFIDVDQLSIVSGLSFPQKNVIKNNVAYCNSNLNATSPRGVSISGSNVSNMITSNISYNNPDGYEFVSNIFDGLSIGIPTILQNISIAECLPPCITTNVAVALSILKAKMCDIQSKIDDILLSV